VTPSTIRVRANANFKGTKAGRIEVVNPDDAEVQSKIAKGWFTVIEPSAEQPARRRRKK
jgi:hypothetical protein